MSFDRLLHLGNVVVDVVLTVGELPERGGDVLASSTATATGGGFNVMAAAARQGLPVTYAGAHGTGPFATQARLALDEAGVELSHPARRELDTGFVVTLVDAGGERTFVTSRGAEATLAPADLGRVRPGSRDLVYLSGYGLLHDANRAALVPWLGALPEDVVVVVDPGPLGHQIPADALDAVLARADWWSCNSAEALLLTGLAEPVAAAAALLGRTGRLGVLVRTGPAGCVLVVRGLEPVTVPGFTVTAVDLNGAGDAHTGVFLAALAAGEEPTEAARRANAAAALAITRRGPATAPTKAELEMFLRTF